MLLLRRSVRWLARCPIMSLTLTTLLLVGCGKSPRTDVPGRTLQDGRTASEYLQSVFQRYRSAESYRDDAVARLTYEVNGRLENEQAPLSVWMDADTVYVKAYDVHVRSEPQATTAWIVDPTTDNHDSQVLRLPPSSQPFEPQSLLADPVLNETLSAGLAGPPPQLDWLFADHPMKRLFDEDFDITFGQPRVLAGLMCQIVLVNADGDHYRFWIDQRSSLIHRVDLPPVQLPDASARQVNLTLELIGATFDAANDSALIEDLPEQPKFVSRFIPLPPVEPAQGLGRTVDPFHLRDRSGRIKIDLPGSDREVTVILFVTADKPSIWNALAFNQWASMMTGDVAAKVRSIAVADQDAENQLPADLSIPIAIDTKQTARRAITNTNRGTKCELVVIDRQGRIAWLQESMSPQDFVSLGSIIGDVLDGVDVPGRLLDQWRSNVATYRNLLAAEMERHRAAKMSK